jgi:Ca2+-transporting ATPase
MLLWGLLIVGTLDSWLRPLLISRSGSGDIPFLLILFGVLGGLAAFGLPGLLFGPVVLAVVFALVAELPPIEPASAGSTDTVSS